MFKRILLSTLLVFSLVSNGYAFEKLGFNRGQSDFNSQRMVFEKISLKTVGDTIVDKLPSGLTFYKDFTLSTSLTADYSIGSPTATFTRSTDATHPATYIDSNGIIQLVTTSDVPRFAGGYYDETGFHSAKGLMIEKSSNNVSLDSYFSNGTTDYWGSTGTATITSDSTYPNPYGGGNIQKIVSTAQYGGIKNSTATRPTLYENKITQVSALVRGSGSVMTYLKVIGGASQYGTPATLSDNWLLISGTFTPDGTGVSEVGVVSNDASTTFYVSYIQCERSSSINNPYPTSFIPTTTAALTRGAETLKYPISGNRTAAQETISIQFMPLGGSFANDGILRRIIDTDTKQRILDKNTTGSVIRTFGNATDDAGSNTSTVTEPTVNTSYNVCSTYQITGNPNTLIYINGILENSSNDNFTSPVWGSNFYIGSNNTSTTQGNILTERISIFNRVLNESEIGSVNVFFLNNNMVEIFEGSVTIPEKILGISTNNYPHSGTAPTYDYHIYRTHDYYWGNKWSQLHNADNDFSGGDATEAWSVMDTIIDLHYNLGKDIMFTVWGTPNWAASDPTQDDPYGGHGGNTPPTSQDYLSDFITQLVTRYNTDTIRNNGGHKKIKYIEIWNEPTYAVSSISFFTGSADDLALMAKTIYTAAKAVDATITILSPGFSGSSYVDDFLNASDGGVGFGRDYIDGLAFHPYQSKLYGYYIPYDGSYPSQWDTYIKNALVAGGLASTFPIYATEQGISGDTTSTFFSSMSDISKAQYVFRVSILGIILGWKSVIWYSHDTKFSGNPSTSTNVSHALDLANSLSGKTITKVTMNVRSKEMTVTCSDGTTITY
jgi:hypothetical protein